MTRPNRPLASNEERRPAQVDKRKASRDRARLLEFFLAHPDEVHTNQALAAMLGDRSDSWTRRLRELREPRHGGYQILSHRDSDKLAPGQYLFPRQERREAFRTARISGRVRAEVLHRDAYTCQSCALARGERYEDGRLVTVHVHHDVADSHGGPPTGANCFTLCARCNEAESNVGPDRPTVDKTMAQVRRLPRKAQRAIYDFLRSVFEP